MTSIATVNTMVLISLGLATECKQSAQGCNRSTYREAACLFALHCTWAHLNQSLVGNLTSSRWLKSSVTKAGYSVSSLPLPTSQVHHHILLKLGDAPTGKNCRSHTDRSVTVPTSRHSCASSWKSVGWGWQVYKGENWPDTTLHSPVLLSCPTALNL